jgi:hypothetical protein
MSMSRWLRWTPLGGPIFGTSLDPAPPKPPKPSFEGFEGSPLGIFQKIEPPAPRLPESGSKVPDGIPPHDPAEWRGPFVRWLESSCAYHPRCFGGIGCLHVAFCTWEIAHNGVPCTRDTFERMLEESGHLIAEGLVSGLILREDFVWANSKEIKNATRR